MPPKGYQFKPIEERFWAKIRKADDGCWYWMGANNGVGYGTFWVKWGQRVYAHRYSFEMAKGPIPESMVLDHLCRHPACVNPDHLEAVPPWVNSRRGLTVPATNVAKTTCPRGHEYDAVKSYKGRPLRYCKRCQNIRNRVGYLKRNGLDWVAFINGAPYESLLPSPSHAAKWDDADLTRRLYLKFKSELEMTSAS
jgi:hypothetical protein